MVAPTSLHPCEAIVAVADTARKTGGSFVERVRIKVLPGSNAALLRTVATALKRSSAFASQLLDKVDGQLPPS